MKYKITNWTIKDLIEKIENKVINLNPEYQRNPIWTTVAQKELINTIKKSQPIPNFFLKELGDDKYEMVDGQQRGRTIVGYWNGLFSDKDNVYFSKDYKEEDNNKKIVQAFKNYKLNITIITKIEENESIELFYALVNSSGMRINRPELKKAEYYNTKFLKLITELADNKEFKKLNLFTKQSINRMNDIDFVSELVTFIKYGFSDKKEKVDNIFEKDINEDEYTSLKLSFLQVIEKLNTLDLINPIYATRYSQKNDFYSLFAFIFNNIDIEIKTFKYFYKLLLKCAKYITPSQEECDPFKEYAINCVSQSNSKKAREGRNSFLVQLLLNKEKSSNDTQKRVLEFFKLKEKDLSEVSEYTTININKIP